MLLANLKLKLWRAVDKTTIQYYVNDGEERQASRFVQKT